MTEFALRPDSAGPRSGSDLLFSNRLREPFAENRGTTLAENPPGSAADGERRRLAAARRLSRPTGSDAAGGNPNAPGGNPNAPDRPARGPFAPGARHADGEATR